ncbi:hypothetical protein A2U01_0009690, partial [Trifolium medium]|nr:hypothetical protein [Trifolium medium]
TAMLLSAHLWGTKVPLDSQSNEAIA